MESIKSSVFFGLKVPIEQFLKDAQLKTLDGQLLLDQNEKYVGSLGPYINNIRLVIIANLPDNAAPILRLRNLKSLCAELTFCDEKGLLTPSR